MPRSCRELATSTSGSSSFRVFPAGGICVLLFKFLGEVVGGGFVVLWFYRSPFLTSGTSLSPSPLDSLPLLQQAEYSQYCLNLNVYFLKLP